MVLCEICHVPKNYRKYRRHLRYHHSHNEISLEKLNEIIFYTKKRRRNTKFTFSALPRQGYVCGLSIDDVKCGLITLDLSLHLTRYHGLSKTDSLYISTMRRSEVILKRSINLCDDNKLVYNPMYNFSGNTHCILTEKQTTDAYSQPIEDLSQTNEISPDDDIFTFQDESGDNSNNFDHMQYIRNIIKDTISAQMNKEIHKFKIFLGTMLGGAKSPISIQMDITNIYKVLNGIGEKDFWNVNKLNEYITTEMKIGKAPSTSHSRLKSVERFTHYLRTDDCSLLPDPKTLSYFEEALKGIQCSILRKRTSRYKQIMRNSRKMFDFSVSVLSKWRQTHFPNMHQQLFRKYKFNTQCLLDQREYDLMLGHLVLEILIPNGQRPGVIQGLIVEEVINGESDLVSGYHRLRISDHKTGYIQHATLFLSSSSFDDLLTFVNFVVPKLPKFVSGIHTLLKTSHVFYTFDGTVLNSSRLTPLFRKALLNMGISFSGTVTDLRKASATLTGKYFPQMHELMSLFLEHSRKVHDKNYRIHLGHDGLIQAYKALEIMHIQPHSINDIILEPSKIDSILKPIQDSHLSENMFSLDPLSSKVQDCLCDNDDVILDLSDDKVQETIAVSDSSTSIIDFSLLYDKPDSIASINPESSDDSVQFQAKTFSPVRYVHSNTPITFDIDTSFDGQFDNYHDVENFDSRLNTQNSKVLSVSPSSEAENIAPSLSLNTTFDLHQGDVNLPNHHDVSFPSSNNIHTSNVGTSDNFHPYVLNSKGSSPNFLLPNNSKTLPLRECSLKIDRLDPNILLKNCHSLRNKFAGSNKSISKKNAGNPKCLFLNMVEKRLFSNVFSYFISKVSSKQPISKREVINFAHTAPRFGYLMKSLKARFSIHEINTKIYNKIRSLGYSRCSDVPGGVVGNDFPSCSIQSPVHFPHHRSIFRTKEDENHFFGLFSIYIERVSKNITVSKRNIFLNSCNDPRYLKLVESLQLLYPNSDVHRQIYNKIRTVGLSKRPILNTLY